MIHNTLFLRFAGAAVTLIVGITLGMILLLGTAFIVWRLA
jgi:hypothetical protein